MKKSLAENLKHHSFIVETNQHKKRRVVPLSKVLKLIKEHRPQRKQNAEGLPLPKGASRNADGENVVSSAQTDTTVTSINASVDAIPIISGWRCANCCERFAEKIMAERCCYPAQTKKKKVMGKKGWGMSYGY